jgi:membrane protease YdiL (CAAX protease family)
MRQERDREVIMTFCSQCGTEAVASYCKHCGAPTPSRDSINGTPTSLDDREALSSDRTIEGAPPLSTKGASVPANDAPPSTPVPYEFAPNATARRQLAWETRFVMAAFLLPVIVNAVVALVQGVSGIGDLTRFPTVVPGHPLENMFVGMLAYLSVASLVPLALFLLNRTGQSPSVLGLGVPNLKVDLLPAIGIGLSSFGLELVLLVPLMAFAGSHSLLIENVTASSLPKYYIVYGLAMSAITAVAEEVMMNGYFMTRLHQLGWSPRASLLLSLALRTSYHVYYGLGFILTIPFGYLVTRSFQKHHKLNRPILAHFLFDAVLISIAILK